MIVATPMSVGIVMEKLSCKENIVWRMGRSRERERGGVGGEFNWFWQFEDGKVREEVIALCDLGW